MLRKIMRVKTLGVFLFVFFFPLLLASAQPHRGRGDHDPGERERRHHSSYYLHYPYPDYGRVFYDAPMGFISIVIGGVSFYYYEGVYYRRHVNGYVVVPAPIGAVISIPPYGSRSVIINGVTYYYTLDGVYYRPCPEGYVVVPQPVIVEAPVVVAGVTSVVDNAAAVPLLKKEKLGIADVMVLSRAGINDDTIIGRIIDSGSVYNLSVEEVEALRKNGVSTRVVNFMLGHKK